MHSNTEDFSHKETSKPYRESHGNCSSLHPSTTSCKISPKMHEHSIREEQPEIRVFDELRQPSKNGTKVVVGKSLIWKWKDSKHHTQNLIISSDAAKGNNSGWAAHCGEISSGGLWQSWEKEEHINVLEMKASLIALKTLVNGNHLKMVDLLIDNQTALAHIVKMGRPTNPTLITLIKEIWSPPTQKEINPTAEYIPSNLNKEADFESRNSKDWGTGN